MRTIIIVLNLCTPTYECTILNRSPHAYRVLATLIEKMMDFIWQLVKVGIKDRTDDREVQKCKNCFCGLVP